MWIVETKTPPHTQSLSSLVSQTSIKWTRSKQSHPSPLQEASAEKALTSGTGGKTSQQDNIHSISNPYQPTLAWQKLPRWITVLLFCTRVSFVVDHSRGRSTCKAVFTAVGFIRLLYCSVRKILVSLLCYQCLLVL